MNMTFRETLAAQRQQKREIKPLATVQSGEVWCALAVERRVLFARAGAFQLELVGLELEAGDLGQGELVFETARENLLIAESRHKLLPGIQNFPAIQLNPHERLALSINFDGVKDFKAFPIYFTYFLRMNNG